MISDELCRVPIEYLWVGLELQEDIYNYNGEVLLVPKGKVITEPRLASLFKFEGGNKYITTPRAMYDLIMDKNNIPEDMRKLMLQTQKGYEALNHGVDEIMAEAKKYGKVSSEPVAKSVAKIPALLEGAGMQIIFSCIDLPRPMGEELQRHCLNVALLNGLMAECLDLPDQEARDLITVGMLHDIGKTKIPGDKYSNRGVLSKREEEMARIHCLYTAEMLTEDFDTEVKMAAYYHHERIDGSGYPEGLKGDKIPLYARITAISDTYDNLVYVRTGEKSKPLFDVMAELAAMEGKELDEELTMLFLNDIKSQYLGKTVRMSDGVTGNVVYIPPNDLGRPVVKTGTVIKQTDEEWKCREVLLED